MWLKRVHDHSTGKPVVAGVKVLHLGRKQKFSPNLLKQGAMEGWLAFAEGKITLTDIEGTKHVFKVVRVPGRYCSHCGIALESEEAARGHLASAHAGVPSPDPENPAGYMVTHAFKGVQEKSNG